jgi:hypothetical protein
MTSDERLSLIETKIDRANKHIADLDIARKAFLETKPYAVSTKRDPQTRRLIYYVTKVDQTPIALASAAGDILHNLRSALDHLAYQLFLVGPGGGGGGKGNRVYFPIARDAAEYNKKDTRQKIKGLRSDVVDAIDAIDAIEPYGGGNSNDLWTLHALNNVDKHRLLVTVGGSFQSVGIGSLLSRSLAGAFKDVKIELGIKPADTLCPLKVGDELFIDSPDAQFDEHMPFELDVALSEPGIIEGKPLLETVRSLSKLVENIIPQFKPFLA